jgi:hypothetical protein
MLCCFLFVYLLHMIPRFFFSNMFALIFISSQVRVQEHHQYRRIASGTKVL